MCAAHMRLTHGTFVPFISDSVRCLESLSIKALECFFQIFHKNGIFFGVVDSGNFVFPEFF